MQRLHWIQSLYELLTFILFVLEYHTCSAVRTQEVQYMSSSEIKYSSIVHARHGPLKPSYLRFLIRSSPNHLSQLGAIMRQLSSLNAITRPGVHRAPWVFGRKLSAGAALGTEQIFCSRRLDLPPISVCPIPVRCLGHNAPVWKRRSEVIWPPRIPRYWNRPAAHLSVY